MRTIILTSTTVFVLAFAPVAMAQKNSARPKATPKFIDDIEITLDTPPQASATKEVPSKFADFKPLFSKKTDAISPATSLSPAPIENASALQFKYSLLLNTEVEDVKNLALFQAIDEWWGTPYVYGGTTKRGIDCSAFVQAIYTGLFGVSLPRTAHEQQRITQPVSRTQLKQGDLVFFNTRGGVSHVGVYLQNNKFVHASSGGVTISDLFDDYWMRRFISAGRYDTPVLALLSKS